MAWWPSSIFTVSTGVAGPHQHRAEVFLQGPLEFTFPHLPKMMAVLALPGLHVSWPLRVAAVVVTFLRLNCASFHACRRSRDTGGCLQHTSGCTALGFVSGLGRLMALGWGAIWGASNTLFLRCHFLSWARKALFTGNSRPSNSAFPVGPREQGCP